MMSTTQVLGAQSRLLIELTKQLDISDTDYEQAVKRYQAVGEWLGADGSELEVYDPDIKPQGSFRLGTVIKPITDATHYDIDLVCCMDAERTEISQKQLKQLVGDRLKAHAKYAKMLDEEGKRCWTLEYAESTSFHLDILPAIPDDELPQSRNGSQNGNPLSHALLITDKSWPQYNELDAEWPRTNPEGFAVWFESRMAEQVRIVKAQIQDVPPKGVKTPLQQAVQILKRHRDIYFKNDDGSKPASIILTTLAALSYSNEADVAAAIQNILGKLDGHFEPRADGLWLPNPVNPNENFLDRWKGDQSKKRKFDAWLAKAVTDFTDALQYDEAVPFSKAMQAPLGQAMVEKAAAAMHEGAQVYKFAEPTVLAPARPASVSVVSSPRFSVDQRHKPYWPVLDLHTVTISARFSKNGTSIDYRSDGSPLPKHGSIYFSAATDVPPPFTVYWQVVNTGPEAEQAEGLRGSIFPSKTAGIGGLKQKEGTAYKGSHWIQCFIVKDDMCVAHSREFVVNIQ